MKKSRLVELEPYRELLGLARHTDQRVLARWALACIGRVLPGFEAKYPRERRPRRALDALREWLNSGVFRMATIRKASLDAHAAARAVEADDVARSVAHGAGQAVATAHVKTHAVAAALYAATAVRDRARPRRAAAAAERERAWQLRRLRSLITRAGSPGGPEAPGSRAAPRTRRTHRTAQRRGPAARAPRRRR